MRIPQELKDALDAAAAENKRSLTAEVVARLEMSLLTTPEQSGPLTAQVKNEVKKELDAAVSEVREELGQLRLELQQIPWAKELIEAIRKQKGG